jgi:dipeptidyl aminopeptidase/acylaminoacyl peptidase
LIDRPYGTWPSPITAASVAAQSVRLSSVTLDGEDIYWLEGRPSEGGRSVLVRRRADGVIEDVTPPPFNVRTRVHEYGGGAYLVDRGTVWFSNFADQRVYTVGRGQKAPPQSGPKGPALQALTPEGAWFYADFCRDRVRQRVIAVREDHTDTSREAVTTLVAISDAGNVSVIASGRDFYASPRLSPDGTRLAWLCWDHPQMPWDGAELWVADVSADGTLSGASHVAGSAQESAFQPGWLADGSLIVASDRTGWWQLYRVMPGPTAVALRALARTPDPWRRWKGPGLHVGAGFSRHVTPRPLLHQAPEGSEFGRPLWVFGMAVWAEAAPGTLVTAWAVKGVWHLGVVDVAAGTLRHLDSGLDPQDWLAASGSHAYVIAASPRRPPMLARISLRDGTVEAIKESSPASVDEGYISAAESIEFATKDADVAHAFYYAPRNRDAECRSELPPLVAISHGGPTAAAARTFDVRIQYWTSRGFAVVDVNYGGSTGYGRRYRERLRGQWGHVDVDDMIDAVIHLVDAGKADPNRLIIRGGSAGGYTTLAALTFHSGVFKAGASYYGVSDLELLARDTHKFEARYLDSLVGPYPAMADEYRRRSPIHSTDLLASALIFFQGLDDRVVPPNQSEGMADTVRRKGLPVAYVAFEGEQHGFRKAENIVRSLEMELHFYAAVFGFVPADGVTVDVLKARNSHEWSSFPNGLDNL